MAAGGLIAIRYDERNLRRISAMLAGIPSGMKIAMSRALNRTAAKAKTNVVGQLKGEINVKVAAAKKGIKIVKATRAHWVARLQITGDRIPLVAFGARPTNKGVTYKITIGKRKLARHAFIQTMPTRGDDQTRGHKGVFVRKAKAADSEGSRKNRLPILQLMGPSLGIVFENAPGLAAEAMMRSEFILSRNINNQVNFLLSRARAKSMGAA